MEIEKWIPCIHPLCLFGIIFVNIWPLYMVALNPNKNHHKAYSLRYKWYAVHGIKWMLQVDCQFLRHLRSCPCLTGIMPSGRKLWKPWMMMQWLVAKWKFTQDDLRLSRCWNQISCVTFPSFMNRELMSTSALVQDESSHMSQEFRERKSASKKRSISRLFVRWVGLRYCVATHVAQKHYWKLRTLLLTS